MKLINKILIANVVIITILLTGAIYTYYQPDTAQNKEKLQNLAEVENTKTTIDNNLTKTLDTGQKPETLSNLETCIITINSQKYDVTNFKDLHSGGDIFECNTDMTAVFNSQHGRGILRQMEKFKIN
ncbi:hypothetical protein H6802_01670 [Candidatus Nomurabacteria bacterium]|uniref:Cytochrome b5 heme-binding domain-containing protein n=1 Tax=candidate division WWE3 bacterium TaxID=2053526 RepID=A0A955E0D5_UNCKA|nr:hypothetical protein [candidate division WWE3 bacterium]MCB9823643.1 hypothetical protein [Candidatus Nomurabacteria bacterium]MCB9827279.1 hypothetical protein [Candidatus Nomurabacteria bacterium]MCB9827438.1 hypothetical protein [Candidatus Nomurabacteria bacterium]HXK52828.1 hypothetical protein [bacterium]